MELALLEISYYYHVIVHNIKNSFNNIMDKFKYNQRRISTYIRLSLLFTTICITGYILTCKSMAYQVEAFGFTNIPIIVLFIPVVIMAYSAYKIYDPINNNNNINWKFNIKHKIIFYTATILQGYVFWILLLNPILFFCYNEVIFNTIIKITKVYTIEEKIMYVFQYFDHYIQSTALTIEEQDILRYKLRKIRFYRIVDETSTLKDIQYYVRLVIQTEYYRNTIMCMEDLIVRIQNLMNDSPWWYPSLRDTIAMVAIIKTIKYIIDYYTQLWTIIKKLQDPYELYHIAREVLSMDPHHRGFFYNRHAVLEILTNVKAKLPSILDIILFYGIEDIPLQLKLIFIGITIGLSGTLLLPNFIQYLKPLTNPILKDDTIYVTFLEDISSIPVINPYNVYYFLGLGILTLAVSLYYRNPILIIVKLFLTYIVFFLFLLP